VIQRTRVFDREKINTLGLRVGSKVQRPASPQQRPSKSLGFIQQLRSTKTDKQGYAACENEHKETTACSFGLSATNQQYFSLRTNQPPAISQQYFSLRTNQHQPSATS
jgi:hypothetical protein